MFALHEVKCSCVRDGTQKAELNLDSLTLKRATWKRWQKLNLQRTNVGE